MFDSPQRDSNRGNVIKSPYTNDKRIISGIKEIYNTLSIPHGLRMHMARVASVAELVVDHWKGPEIDKTELIAACLVHDVGNIIRLNVKSKNGIKMLEEKNPDLAYWQKVGTDARKKYGTDDHIATKMILEELGVNKRLIATVSESTSVLGSELLNSSKDFVSKVRLYADLRSGPHSILSVKERFKDVKKRRPDPKWDHLMDVDLVLEKQIFEFMDIKPNDIDDMSVEPYLKKYMKMVI